jgi:hypothetical protein
MVVQIMRSPKRTTHAPSVYRGVYITKVPLVSWNLAVRFHVPLSGEHVKLFFRKSRIDKSKWDAVECGIPSSEEGVLPSKQHDAEIINE